MVLTKIKYLRLIPFPISLVEGTRGVMISAFAADR